MTKERKLEIFRQALEDWEKERNNFTCVGFCWYFTYKLQSSNEFKIILKELKKSLGIKRFFVGNDCLWFNESGFNIIGKSKRIKLIKKTIKRLENRL